mgnify:CR=1 FL=1
MNSNLENAMAKQTEQATVQAMVESINNGMTPQGSATPDSNCLSLIHISEPTRH